MNDYKVVEKPWGSEIWWAHTDKYVGKLIKISPNKRLSKQYHQVKDETIYIVKGTLHLVIGDDTHLYLSPGESYHITPTTVHRFCSDGQEVELFEVSTPEVDDVIRISDDFNRTSAKEEYKFDDFGEEI